MTGGLNIQVECHFAEHSQTVARVVCPYDMSAPRLHLFHSVVFVAIPGLDKDKCIPRVHHVLQASHTGPPVFPTQEVEVLHS